MRRSIILGCLGIVGVLLLVFGILVAGLFDPLVNSYIAEELVLQNGTDVYQNWRQPPVVPHLRIYFFNVTNKDQFLSGHKPVLQEVGPYCYRERWEKVNITFNDNGTVSYETQKFYYFDRSKSIGSEEDIVTTLNIPMMTAVSKWRFAAILAKLALSSMLEVLKVEPFVTRTVGEFMWGYDDPLLKIAKDILPPEQRLPYDKFGFYSERNGSSDGLLNVFTGEDGEMSRYTHIESFNHEQSLDVWLSDECNTIKGTDGSSFSPGITRSSVLHLFNKNFCRSIPLAYWHDVEHSGVNTFRFTPPADIFANVSMKPENECFCVGGPPCAGNGLFNISSCKYGSPTLVSWPHFYQADPKYLSEVEGLKPDPDKHALFIDVSPRTGSPLKAQARLQINIAVPHVPEVKPAATLREIIFPVMWFEDGVTELPENIVELLQYAENVPASIKSSLTLSFFLVGSVVVVGVCVTVVAAHLDLPIPFLNPGFRRSEGQAAKDQAKVQNPHHSPPKAELTGHTNSMVSDHPEHDRA